MLSVDKAIALDREQLHKIAIPNRTDVSQRWKGVNHGDLADAIIAGAERRGLLVIKEAWCTNPNMTDMFGSVDLQFAEDLGIQLPKGIGISLGVRHSNAGRYAVTLLAGGRVFVCSNGMIVGEYTLKRKHTSFIDLESEVNEAIEAYIGMVGHLGALKTTMESVEVSDELASFFVMDAAQQGVLPWRSIKPVWEEWKMPTFIDFEARNYWSLYNSFTYVAKDLAPVTQMSILQRIPEMMGCLDA